LVVGLVLLWQSLVSALHRHGPFPWQLLVELLPSVVSWLPCTSLPNRGLETTVQLSNFKKVGAGDTAMVVGGQWLTWQSTRTLRDKAAQRR
jgi:hypothetical protein